MGKKSKKPVFDDRASSAFYEMSTLNTDDPIQQALDQKKKLLSSADVEYTPSRLEKILYNKVKMVFKKDAFLSFVYLVLILSVFTFPKGALVVDLSSDKKGDEGLGSTEGKNFNFFSSRFLRKF